MDIGYDMVVVLKPQFQPKSRRNLYATVLQAPPCSCFDVVLGAEEYYDTKAA